MFINNKHRTESLRSKDGYAVRAILPRPEEGVAKAPVAILTVVAFVPPQRD